mmetsp:Transcript_27232/g.71720  ORF Transcript_27232/g.71720 Transcript_27232/m.71720 type:complete len:93 (-) Transcript_27232:43-321(-)
MLAYSDACHDAVAMSSPGFLNTDTVAVRFVALYKSYLGQPNHWEGRGPEATPGDDVPKLRVPGSAMHQRFSIQTTPAPKTARGLWIHSAKQP